ncbi:hypothetical protein Tco_0983249 [Tanacetum coccineum]
MSMEALQAQEDLIKSIESFLKKFNRISFGKTPKVLLQAWDNFIEVKHAQPEEVQELLSKLVQDMKIISDELSEYINTPAWNRPLVYCDDDDDEDYTIAITPVLSTGMPSSVEIHVPIPSESKGVPKVCDVPFHDNSPPLDISKDQSEDFSSTDEDSFSSNDVEISFLPTDRSDFYHEEFADENLLTISPPEYDRFCFKIEPELGNLTMDVVGNIFQESEPRVHVLTRSGSSTKRRKPSQNGKKLSYGLENAPQHKHSTPKSPSMAKMNPRQIEG